MVRQSYIQSHALNFYNFKNGWKHNALRWIRICLISHFWPMNISRWSWCTSSQSLPVSSFSQVYTVYCSIFRTWLSNTTTWPPVVWPGKFLWTIPNFAFCFFITSLIQRCYLKRYRFFTFKSDGMGFESHRWPLFFTRFEVPMFDETLLYAAWDGESIGGIRNFVCSTVPGSMVGNATVATMSWAAELTIVFARCRWLSTQRDSMITVIARRPLVRVIMCGNSIILVIPCRRLVNKK